jgi:DNA-directed RNA polymerase subunit beta
VPIEYLDGKILAHDIVDTETGELLASANDELTADTMEKLIDKASRRSARCT